jgi:hypothetical protein
VCVSQSTRSDRRITATYLGTGSVANHALLVVGLVAGGGGGESWRGVTRKRGGARPRYAEWRASLVARGPDKATGVFV